MKARLEHKVVAKLFKTRKSGLRRAGKRTLAALALALGIAGGISNAEVTDLGTSPLAQSSSTNVLPNLMFTLDASGSMGWDFLGDNVDPIQSFITFSSASANTGKSRCNNSTCSSISTRAVRGDPPYYSNQFNGVFYNPQITYKPGRNADGTCRTIYDNNNFTSYLDCPAPLTHGLWTAVAADSYQTSGTIPFSPTATVDLTTQFSEIVYCKSNSNVPPDAVNCRRNGINTANPFLYNSASTANGFPDGAVSSSSTNFKYPQTQSGAPFYYVITPVEYCSDANLTTCVASTVPTTVGSITYSFPALVRYCKNSTDANAAAPVSGSVAGSARCESKYFGSYTFPRYGQFTRTDIVSTTPTYGGRPTRSDCAAAPNCTYAEEMTNFANWFAYYRTRIHMMKTAAGNAFKTIDDKYRVGFITINPGSPVQPSNSANGFTGQYLPIAKFDVTQKANWYTTFYNQPVGQSTPLRQALSRVGRHFAGKTDGINSGMPEDPMQYSCQQNFALLTTDGFWNGSAGVQIDGVTAIGNQDNVDAGFSTRAFGAFDGALAGASDTLADVAMYYYKTDLRPTGSIGALGIDVGTDNVPTTGKDTNPAQHMVTFTLGLADGLMTYIPNYDTSTTGDFANIKTSSTTCFWASGTCNWPVPVADQNSALDDLWHAAVNGRGTYYNARDPSTLAAGLGGALAGVNIQTGAAAASATSSPNITQTSNFIFSSTFRTVKWDGEVAAQQIDINTGNVLPPIVWSAQAQLDSVLPASRTIYTFTTDTVSFPTKLKPFLWANLTASEQAFLSGKCNTPFALSQCSSLSLGQQTQASNGSTMLDYLRGSAANAPTLYRQRDHVLGDTVNATPAFVATPTFKFQDNVTPSYGTFQTTAPASTRTPVLYIGANDGMLHAFNGNTGAEMWAYVPSMVLSNMYLLADNNYATKHTYFVDGSPQVMDVFIGGAWKTILVGGLNLGGRGFYALDITDPTAPKALWEFKVRNPAVTACAATVTAAIGASDDCDLGSSYGNPVITKRAFDGKWVVLVTSGYDNVNPGDGHGYLYVLDAATGTILRKVDTGAGSTTTCPAGLTPAFTPPCPSGLAKISAFATDFIHDNTTLKVYGGDLFGNVWRFDTSVDPPAVLNLAQLTDAGGKPQSITSRPELGQIQGFPVLFIGTGRYLGVTDLSDPSTLVPPLPYAYQQSLYAIKDTATSLGNIRAGGTLVQQTIIQPTTTTRTVASPPNTVDWTVKNGWFVDFNPGNQSPGERVNLDPQLVLGTLLVATNVPNSNACTVGGDSWLYGFNYYNGQYVLTAPSQVVGSKITGNITVGMVVVQLPSGALKDISTGATGTKLTTGVNVGGGGGGGRRVSWRELMTQ